MKSTREKLEFEQDSHDNISAVCDIIFTSLALQN